MFITVCRECLGFRQHVHYSMSGMLGIQATCSLQYVGNVRDPGNMFITVCRECLGSRQHVHYSISGMFGEVTCW